VNRLLFVEDDESNRVALAALLEEEGFEVDSTPSFEEASRLLRAASASYDAVLLDQTLRDGWGTNLIPLVRSALPKAKVLVLSGTVVSPATLDEADGALPKGVYFPDLVARLRLLLGQSR
jgi:DNA-binding response OmpR family regulator